MPRRVWCLALFAVFLGLLGLREVRAEGADQKDGKVVVEVPAQELHRVKVEPGGIEGTLQIPAIPLRTEIGTRVIDSKFVQRITFQRDPKEGRAEDTIQLVNKEIVRGHITQETFPVKTEDGKIAMLNKADLLEVRFEHKKDVSLLAVIIALLTLTAMEVVLGIDNVIFLAIVAGKLPEEQQPKARKIGLAAALGTRLALLFMLSFLLGLTTPIFTIPELSFLKDLEAREVSWRDIILFLGGAFLIGKSVHEMHEKLEHAKAEESGKGQASRKTTFVRAIATIAVIDVIFSLDSVITAVGMVDADQVWIMVTAMIVSMLVMLWFSGPISRFVEKHPTVKVLALAFLILIGVMLVAEGLGQHMNKGYIYFAMAFGVGVEMFNIRTRKGPKPVVV